MLKRSFGVTAGLVLAATAIAPAARAAPAARPVARQLASDFQSAWEITRGRGATVAVLSSGVDGSVSTLAGAVTNGPDYARVGASANVQGTLTASMIAGDGPTVSSPFGIGGLAPAAHILSIRIYPDGNGPAQRRFFDSSRWPTAMAHGIRYAAAHNASVIETDEYAYTSNSAVRSAIVYALAKGSVVVDALGPPVPDPNFSVPYPAVLAGVIGVGTVDLSGRILRKYSSVNAALCVSAPGVRTPATGPGGQPYTWWGSQVATAWVAAAAALVKARYPHLAPALVARALAVSARRGRGTPAVTGSGIVNPAGALDVAAGLSRLTATAAQGPDSVATSQPFSAPPAGDINAIRLNPVILGGFGAALLAGLLCLALAAVLVVRLRRRRRPDDGLDPPFASRPVVPGTGSGPLPGQ